MSSERWERTKQILEEALRLGREQRQAYLESACGADRELRAEVESLIGSYQEAGSQFLAAAAPEVLFPPENAAASSPQNQCIGPYRLIEELGRGGMGQVWLAEQTAPVKRRVALKLINSGMFDAAALQRFQSERQSLAIMDHPAIAKAFDAGATPDGQPYFVMEYVPGVPITEYCDSKKLKIPERLELFIKVCEGVQHAHQKAIIHRDLKPANILVVEVDGQPLPRIIDFGLAKRAASELLEQTQFTLAGSFLGTPGYMSPEQAEGGTQDVDTRTDVYALGALLYVLLTGSLPFETAQWKKQALDQVLRQLREEDPPRPSTKTGTANPWTKTAAEARGLEPKQLASLLRGDLDWITIKAMERDRARRYATPTELAADLRRYLRHEPVQARPASLPYRARKYVRRHRAGVAVVSALAVVVGAFIMVQSLQLRRITRERDRADRIAQFMTEIFKVSDPSERVGNAVTAREVLDNASKEIEASLSKDPELQYSLMSVMGKAYSRLGLFTRAHQIFERAVAIGSAVLGPENPEILDATRELGWVLFQEGKLAEAEALQRRILRTQTRVLGPEHKNTLTTMGNLAVTLCEEQKCSEAENLQRGDMVIEKRVQGAEAVDTLAAADNLSIMLQRNGKLAEAEKLERETLEIQLRVFGRENLGTISSMLNLASILRDLQRYDESEASFRDALFLEAQVLGPDQPETAETRHDLACLLVRRSRNDEALTLLHQAVDHGLEPRVDLQIESDPCFQPLAGDPRFATLVAHAKERAAAQSTK